MYRYKKYNNPKKAKNFESRIGGSQKQTMKGPSYHLISRGILIPFTDPKYNISKYCVVCRCMIPK